MPILPGGGDWTRIKESANAVIKDRFKKKPSKKHPLEEKIINLLFKFCIIAVIAYAIWDFLLK